jgi:hypothetical protein
MQMAPASYDVACNICERPYCVSTAGGFARRRLLAAAAAGYTVSYTITVAADTDKMLAVKVGQWRLTLSNPRGKRLEVSA